MVLVPLLTHLPLSLPASLIARLCSHHIKMGFPYLQQGPDQFERAHLALQMHDQHFAVDIAAQ